MKSVRLEQIIGTHKTDGRKVARYRRALRSGDVFPPVLIEGYARGDYGMVDGSHRVKAHRLEGRKTIRVIVVSRWPRFKLNPVATPRG